MLNIIFEDKYLVAIDKPSGLSSESGAALHPSAERMVQQMLTDRDGRCPYLRAVHRLDRPTSGVLLLAKSKAALSGLMRQFEEKTIVKIYVARVSGHWPVNEGSLRNWLRKSDDGRSAIICEGPEKGAAEVVLHFKVLSEGEHFTQLEIKPETGKFHQIRAQLAHAGFPIIGDVSYGGIPFAENQIMLHAHQLSVQHPITGQKLTLSIDSIKSD